jgi:hypothetical protein
VIVDEHVRKNYVPRSPAIRLFAEPVYSFRQGSGQGWPDDERIVQRHRTSKAHSTAMTCQSLPKRYLRRTPYIRGSSSTTESQPNDAPVANRKYF